MSDTNETFACLNCARTETQIPLVAIRFDGKGNWICSECMPTLIHKAHLLAGKLKGTETISVQDSDH